MNNPVKRSKKIGKGGRVKNGKAYEKWSRNSYLSDIYSQISESEKIWQIYCDNPSKDYFHPCEGNDYLQV
jgi:hypothetical protein